MKYKIADIIFNRDLFANLESKKQKQLKYTVYSVIALIISILNLVLLNFFSIGGLTPDLLLILVVWIAIFEGQFVAIFAGFLCGLLFDILSIDVIGTNALAKTVAGFVAGYFYKENMVDKIMRSYKFLLIVLLSSTVHNFIYYFFYIEQSEISFIPFFLKYGIASSFYTTIFALFAMLLRMPKKELNR